MLHRRNLLIATAGLMSSFGAALATDWPCQYKELTFAVVPAENASGVGDRFAVFVEYLSKELGVPVKLRAANDYCRGHRGPACRQYPNRLLWAGLILEGVPDRR